MLDVKEEKNTRSPAENKTDIRDLVFPQNTINLCESA